MRPIQPALFSAAVIFTVSSFAGTVITDNLPPNTAIININAKQDGLASATGGQAFWYQPFFTGGATELLRCHVEAGTYIFRVINPADAHALFPDLTTQQTNQIFTAWTFNSPWITDYMVFTSAAATNNSIPQLFDGACTNLFSNGPFFNDAASAYAGAVNGHFANAIRTSESGGRGSTNFIYTYTFATADDLIFGIPDNILSDNSGGVSVLVTPAGPTLHVLLGQSRIALQWPTNFSNYTLQRAFSLNPVVAWSTVTNSVQLNGPDFFSTLPATNSAEFFRLAKP